MIASTDFVLGAADAGSGTVCRWRMHVTAITGTTTIKAIVQGSGTGSAAAATPVAATLVTALGSTTPSSTITATGIYDIDATGLVITVSEAAVSTITFDAVGLIG